jgi:hypothetical protein
MLLYILMTSYYTENYTSSVQISLVSITYVIKGLVSYEKSFCLSSMWIIGLILVNIGINSGQKINK